MSFGKTISTNPHDRSVCATLFQHAVTVQAAEVVKPSASQRFLPVATYHESRDPRCFTWCPFSEHALKAVVGHAQGQVQVIDFAEAPTADVSAVAAAPTVVAAMASQTQRACFAVSWCPNDVNLVGAAMDNGGSGASAVIVWDIATPLADLSAIGVDLGKGIVARSRQRGGMVGSLPVNAWFLRGECVTAMDWQPKSSTCLATAIAARAIAIVDSRSGHLPESEFASLDDRRHVSQLSFSPHRPEYLLSSTDEGPARVWDLRNISHPCATLEGGTGHTSILGGGFGAKWHPHAAGMILTVSSGGGEARVWDVLSKARADDGKPLESLFRQRVCTSGMSAIGFDWGGVCDSFKSPQDNAIGSRVLVFSSEGNVVDAPLAPTTVTDVSWGDEPVVTCVSGVGEINSHRVGKAHGGDISQRIRHRINAGVGLTPSMNCLAFARAVTKLCWRHPVGSVLTLASTAEAQEYAKQESGGLDHIAALATLGGSLTVPDSPVPDSPLSRRPSESSFGAAASIPSSLISPAVGPIRHPTVAVSHMDLAHPSMWSTGTMMTTAPVTSSALHPAVSLGLVHPGMALTHTRQFSSLAPASRPMTVPALSIHAPVVMMRLAKSGLTRVGSPSARVVRHEPQPITGVGTPVDADDDDAGLGADAYGGFDNTLSEGKSGAHRSSADDGPRFEIRRHSQDLRQLWALWEWIAGPEVADQSAKYALANLAHSRTPPPGTLPPLGVSKPPEGVLSLLGLATEGSGMAKAAASPSMFVGPFIGFRNAQREAAVRACGWFKLDLWAELRKLPSQTSSSAPTPIASGPRTVLSMLRSSATLPAPPEPQPWITIAGREVRLSKDTGFVPSIIVRCIAEGSYERAALLAVWHGDLRLATWILRSAAAHADGQLEALQGALFSSRSAEVESIEKGSSSLDKLLHASVHNRSAFKRAVHAARENRELMQLTAMVVAGFPGVSSTVAQRLQEGRGLEASVREEDPSHLWTDTCESLQQRMGTRHPYLRCLCSFLASCARPGTGDGSSTWMGSPFAGILAELGLRLHDRVAFACRFLPTGQLEHYLHALVQACIDRSNVFGLLLTGLTDKGVDIIQAYVNRTGDVQTGALLGCMVPPSTLSHSQARKVLHWIQSFRDLLNQWRMWKQRATFDVLRAKILRAMTDGEPLSGSALKDPIASLSDTDRALVHGLELSESKAITFAEAPRTVRKWGAGAKGSWRSSVSSLARGRGVPGRGSATDLAQASDGETAPPASASDVLLSSVVTQSPAVYMYCSMCQCALTLPYLVKESGGSLSWLAKSGSKVQLCPICASTLPRCSLCLISMGSINPLLQVRHETQHSGNPRASPSVKETPSVAVDPEDKAVERSSAPFSDWWTWCQSCRHGGHASHLAAWFASHEICPVAMCSCRCGSLDAYSSPAE
jgi:hypothetical protein